MTFLYFTIYLILISWLAWYINEPKIKTDSFKTGGIVDGPYDPTTIYDLIILKNLSTAIDGLDKDEFYKFSKTVTQLGINFSEPQEAVKILKNAMDKVCR